MFIELFEEKNKVRKLGFIVAKFLIFTYASYKAVIVEIPDVLQQWQIWITLHLLLSAV